MKNLALILAGRADYLVTRIRGDLEIEDWEYFLQGICGSLMDVYDEEWEGFVEDSGDCIELMTILHTRYRETINRFLRERKMLGHDGFDVSFQDVPSSRINLLLVSSFPIHAIEHTSALDDFR